MVINPIHVTDASLSGIGLTVDTLPVIDGATSTQPIRMLLACQIFSVGCMWYENPDREMFLYSYSFDDTKIFPSEQDRETLKAKIMKNSKTHDAYIDLIHRKNDLILVSTKPSVDEVHEAEKAGVVLELTPIGLDGFVFLVNGNNTIGNLTTSDIINIYHGTEKSWKKFTGKDAPIIAYTRQVNSGSQELMRTLVMKDILTDPALTVEEMMFGGMSMLIGGIEDAEDSIGYSLYYYKNNMIDKREIRPNVKLIAVNGIAPTPATIASGTYPFTFPVYVVTRLSESHDSRAYRIKEWLTSKAGQELVRQAGYVPQY